MHSLISLILSLSCHAPLTDQPSTTQPMTPIAHLHRAGSIGNPSSRNLYARIDSNEENQGRPSVEMAKKDKLGKREERRSGSVVEELLATPVPAGGVVELPSTIDLTHSMSDTMSPKK